MPPISDSYVALASDLESIWDPVDDTSTVKDINFTMETVTTGAQIPTPAGEMYGYCAIRNNTAASKTIRVQSMFCGNT